MKNWLIFDCMETVIDLDPMPEQADYALWAFSGSALEKSGVSFDAFLEAYIDFIPWWESKHPFGTEWDWPTRLRFTIEHLFPYELNPELKSFYIQDAFDLFWARYTASCYLAPEKKRVLLELAERGYPLAIASNFAYQGGIAHLLDRTGILDAITYVHTSVGIGIRKPAPAFYRHLLEALNTSPESVLFIGDDYACDYVGPAQLGIPTLLYDPHRKRPEIAARITSFEALLRPEVLRSFKA